MWKLGLLLYPFTALAVAINLFMAGLLGSYLGWGVLSPGTSLALSAVLGVPATWAAGRWLRGLMDEADG